MLNVDKPEIRLFAESLTHVILSGKETYKHNIGLFFNDQLTHNAIMRQQEETVTVLRDQSELAIDQYAQFILDCLNLEEKKETDTSELSQEDLALQLSHANHTQTQMNKQMDALKGQIERRDILLAEQRAMFLKELARLREQLYQKNTMGEAYQALDGQIFNPEAWLDNQLKGGQGSKEQTDKLTKEITEKLNAKWSAEKRKLENTITIIDREKEGKIRELEREITIQQNEMQARLDRLSAERNTEIEELNNLHHNELRDLQNELNEEREKHDGVIEEIKTTLTNEFEERMKKETEELVDEAHRLQVLNDRLVAEGEALRLKMDGIQNELSEMELAHTLRQKEVQELKKDNTQLQEELDQAELKSTTQKAQLTELLRVVEDGEEKRKQEREKMENEVKEVARQLAQKEEETAKANEEMRTAQAVLEKTRKEFEEKERVVERKMAEQTEKMKELEKTAEESSQLRDINENLRSEVQKVLRDLTEAKEEQAKQEERMATLQKEKEEMKQQLAAMAEKSMGEGQTTAEYSRTIKLKDVEIGEMTRKIQELERQLKQGDFGDDVVRSRSFQGTGIGGEDGSDGPDGVSGEVGGGRTEGSGEDGTSGAKGISVSQARIEQLQQAVLKDDELKQKRAQQNWFLLLTKLRHQTMRFRLWKYIEDGGEEGERNRYLSDAEELRREREQEDREISRRERERDRRREEEERRREELERQRSEESEEERLLREEEQARREERERWEQKMSKQRRKYQSFLTRMENEERRKEANIRNMRELIETERRMNLEKVLAAARLISQPEPEDSNAQTLRKSTQDWRERETREIRTYSIGGGDLNGTGYTARDPRRKQNIPPLFTTEPVNLRRSYNSSTRGAVHDGFNSWQDVSSDREDRTRTRRKTDRGRESGMDRTRERGLESWAYTPQNTLNQSMDSTRMSQRAKGQERERGGVITKRNVELSDDTLIGRPTPRSMQRRDGTGTRDGRDGSTEARMERRGTEGSDDFLSTPRSYDKPHSAPHPNQFTSARTPPPRERTFVPSEPTNRDTRANSRDGSGSSPIRRYYASNIFKHPSSFPHDPTSPSYQHTLPPFTDSARAQSAPRAAPHKIFDIKDKVALVTGASSGLGVQFANYLAECGCKVAVCARRKERLDSLVTELTAKGVEALAVKCDASKPDEVSACVQEVKAKFGRIDILINNAGVGTTAPATDMTNDMWLSVIDINLNGVYWFAREVGKIMVAQKYGKIVNIGSIHSNLAISEAVHPVPAYAASKGGVQMLTKALAAEWAKHNITVNAIGPAYFGSEMTEAAIGNKAFTDFIAMRCPTGRVGKEGELNGALHYFSSDASSYTNGQLLTIDGGWNCI
ncbi:putative Gluconate 5-dehydrogenase [Blattamonas nauphoetae]|uniref:Gluconate 5-dehydrogenase n=1 Tax=Blattamonas nauphoetae TaxID=2049346 RepID=A0ABQ9XJN8_9EUKA|nr:putative Gluconate 5-dehydrogenase [Blattamonas nauphoetae]